MTQPQEFIDKYKIKNKGITYQTIGTTLQALSVQLDEKECIYSEAGKMSWMTSNIKMSTHSQGCLSMLSRFLSKESIFVNKFTCESGTGIVTFTTEQAGRLIPIDLTENMPGVIFQKGAFLCSEEGIKRSIAFVKKIGAGLFGGKGFVLQKVKGTGKTYLIADGEVVQYELKDGQELAVDQGNLVAFEETVDFDIRTISGPLNWIFGGEGIFTGLLRGPGKVWMQTRKNILGSNQAIQSVNFGEQIVFRIIGIIISLAFFFCMFIAFILRSYGR